MRLRIQAREWGILVRPKTLAAVGLLLLFALNANAQAPPELVKRNFPSVVAVVMQDENRQPLALGSGFPIASGIVVTNYHVIRGATYGLVKAVGQSKSFTVSGVLGYDRTSDLALISVKGLNVPSLSLDKPSQIVTGDQVYAVSNPLGLAAAFSTGIISGVRNFDDCIFLQITASLTPGSNGGPVLNSSGKVIGVAVSLAQDGESLNLAVPADKVAELLAHTSVAVPLQAVGSDWTPLEGLLSPASQLIYGVQFLWDAWSIGSYSFSIRNDLDFAVKNIRFLVIFYDLDGNPIDAKEMTCKETIPSGLAKRMQGSVHWSVSKLNTPDASSTPKGRIEIRVLDFELAQ